MNEQPLGISGTDRGRGKPRSAVGVNWPVTPFWMMIIFLAFVVARYIGINHRLDILDAIRAEFLLGMAAMLASLANLMVQQPAVGRGRRLIFATGILFVLIAIQVPIAEDPILAPVVFNNRVFKFSLLTVMIVALVQSPRSLRWFIATFLFAMFYVTEETFEGLITGSLMWENQGVMRLHGAAPMYGHPNSLGGVSLGTLPYIWYLYPTIKSRLLRGGLIATATTSLACVLYSGSRTAYVGFFAFVVYLWWFSRNRVKSLVVGIAIAVVVIPFLPDQYINRFKSIAGEEEEGRSKETRIVILEDATKVFLQYPLGIGVASFPAVRERIFGRNQDTHNLYLEVATNIGVQGLIAFLCFVFLMMQNLLDCARGFEREARSIASLGRTLDRQSRYAQALARHYNDLEMLRRTALATSGFILIRLVVGFFGMDLYEIYWWFGAGLSIALGGILFRARLRSDWLRRHAIDDMGSDAE